VADSLAMSLMHAYTEASPLRNGLGLSSKIRWQPPPHLSLGCQALPGTPASSLLNWRRKYGVFLFISIFYLN